MSRSETLPPLVVLSLMSGTSADGIDAVAVRLEAQPGKLDWQLLARKSQAYPERLRRRLLQAMRPEGSDVSLLTQLHAEVGQAYADCAESMVAELDEDVDLISLSGQTVYHIPRADEARDWRVPSTLQLGEAALVAERCRTPVIGDFRQSDMAAGGQGAPLVPFGDLHLFGREDRAVAVHNLGGISNLTYIDRRSPQPLVLAFDTGPANCLMDEAAERLFGRDFDAGGEAAAQGTADDELLTRWLTHPYFSLRPPKTTGRELFTLDAFLDDTRDLAAHDLLATLCALTARSVALAYREHVLPRGLDEVLVAGGGARNRTLMDMLSRLLPVPVYTMDRYGLEPQDREALAFAVMGYYGFLGLPNTLPAATGARRAVVAGKLVRHDLPPEKH